MEVSPVPSGAVSGEGVKPLELIVDVELVCCCLAWYGEVGVGWGTGGGGGGADGGRGGEMVVNEDSDSCRPPHGVIVESDTSAEDWGWERFLPLDWWGRCAEEIGGFTEETPGGKRLESSGWSTVASVFCHRWNCKRRYLTVEPNYMVGIILFTEVSELSSPRSQMCFSLLITLTPQWPPAPMSHVTSRFTLLLFYVCLFCVVSLSKHTRLE